MGTLDVELGQASQLNGAFSDNPRKRPTGKQHEGPVRAPRKRTPRSKVMVEPESSRVPWYVQHWREAMLFGAVLASVGTFLHESGWLVSPAKESAVKDLESKVTDMHTEIREHRTAIGAMDKTLGRIEGKLDALKPGAAAVQQKR